jgi:hypothetical protein
MILLKIFMSGMIILQFSGVFKSVIKSTARVSKSVISPSGKIIKGGKSLNKASAMLLADDAASLHKTVLSDEKALAVQSDELAVLNKDIAKEGSTVGRRTKSADKLEKELRKLSDERMEDALEDLIYENLDRTGTLFENSVHELLNEPKFTMVSSYFNERHNFKLKRRLDLFLLLNERDVDGFFIGRREVSRILAMYSDVFSGRALAFLLLDLSEYKPVVESIRIYASKRDILLTDQSAKK